MAQPIREAEVAQILQISVDHVRQLFADGDLTGAKSDGEWRTTQALLEGDLVVLTETARVACLREGKYVSPRFDETPESDPGYLRTDTLDEIIGRLRAHAE